MTVWYIARGAGLAALVLLSISTCIGALMSRSAPSARAGLDSAGRRYVTQYVHRVTAGLGVLVLAVHITAILADSYAHVGWAGALVPFTSGYRPGWVALGSIAAYTFVLVTIVGMARGAMARSVRAARIWRGLHCLAYAGWLSAIAHGFMSGTDSSVGWVRALYIVCLAGVVLSVGARLLRLSPAGAGTSNRFAPARVTEVAR